MAYISVALTRCGHPVGSKHTILVERLVQTLVACTRAYGCTFSHSVTHGRRYTNFLLLRSEKTCIGRFSTNLRFGQFSFFHVPNFRFSFFLIVLIVLRSAAADRIPSSFRHLKSKYVILKRTKSEKLHRGVRRTI